MLDFFFCPIQLELELELDLLSKGDTYSSCMSLLIYKWYSNWCANYYTCTIPWCPPTTRMIHMVCNIWIVQVSSADITNQLTSTGIMQKEKHNKKILSKFPNWRQGRNEKFFESPKLTFAPGLKNKEAHLLLPKAD